jgi:peptidoglycan/LPS O-acetylase OafA/YrhL
VIIEPSPKTNTLPFLDGLRGLAALYVVIFHARWLMWEGFTEGFSRHPERYGLPARLIAYASLVFYYGHQAVIFFFVLSGFVIHLRYARALHADPDARFDLLPYLRRRVRRLYPVLIVTILLTFVLDSIGRAAGFSVYESRTIYTLINDVRPAFDLGRLLNVIALVPAAPEWGSNLPLWSLRYEWAFYLLYPFLWLVFRRSTPLATFILIIVSALSFVPGLWYGEGLRRVAASMIIWWCGALLAEVYIGRIRLRLARVAPLALLLIVLPFSVEPFFRMDETLRDVLWGLAFMGVLAGLLALQRAGRLFLPRLLERLRGLGAFSYTLYATHFPILFLIGGWLIARSGDGVLPQTYEWIGIGTVICVVVAWALHFIVERPFAGR